MMSRYVVTVVVEVHDPKKVIAAAQRYANEQDPGMGDGITTVERALRELIDPGVPPLDHGFEIFDSSAELEGE
jgi:hypothetical protein